MIDAHCSQVSYAHHLLPVWRALGEHRGRFTAGPHAVEWLRARGVDARDARKPPVTRTPMLVASYPDLCDSRGRPLALLEHGAGQTYRGLDSGGYAGGKDREAVSLFLCPSERVALLNRGRYPAARVEVVGSPRLDRWHEQPREVRSPPTVCLSFHWAADFPVPEGRPAWPHWVKHLPWLAGRIPGLLGHGHPRAIDRYRRRYETAGIEVVTDFEDVLERADVYAVDISSTGFEAAAAGLSVVWLGAPWYDPQSGHGLRWGPEAGMVGSFCDDPADLPGITEARSEGSRSVFAFRDGHAAERAAAALVGWASSLAP